MTLIFAALVGLASWLTMKFAFELLKLAVSRFALIFRHRAFATSYVQSFLASGQQRECFGL